MNINPTNFNTINVTNQGEKRSQAEPEASKEKKEAPQQQAETKEVSANDIFTYMSGTAAMANVKVTKAPSAQVVERIGALMEQFEEGVIAGLAQLEEEMGAVPAYQNLSEEDKMALAAELFTSHLE